MDLAPIDLLNGVTKNFVNAIPASMMPDELKSHAIDFKFHWVNESGKPAKLTAGLSILPTVELQQTSF